MRITETILLLAFVAQAWANETVAKTVGATHDSGEDLWIDKVFKRASWSPAHHAYLESMMIGKPGHIEMPTSRLYPTSRQRPLRSILLIPRFSLGGRTESFPNPKSQRVCMQNVITTKVAAASPEAVVSRPTRSGRSAIAAQASATVLENAKEVVRDDLRNIAIVAHVDHGKTTLVDAMLQSRDCGDDRGCIIDKDERMMDNNDQERERGITILAKNAAISYKGTKINIVDTPGHADFGGEVERVLGMVDGVLLLVDASEGPKPQTRFVLKKAIDMGLKILVVVNKIDRPSARPDYVLDTTFDLFCELGASDDQIDFPIVYTSAINRLAGDDPAADMTDMDVLFQKILDLPKPPCNPNGPLQLQISNIASDNFIGRLGIGRIRSGVVKRNTPVGLSAGPGTDVVQAKIGELFNFDTLGRAAIDEAAAGEIVVFSGVQNFNIGDTIVALDDPRPLEPISVEQPTMSITFGVNKSPFAGKVGKLLTGRQIRERLDKELETNVALRVDDTEDTDTFLVSGRGLLHMTVLIETMRREGFELMVGCPRVIEKTIEDQRHEPFEFVDVEVPEQYSGSVIDLLNRRKGCMKDMSSPTPEGQVTLQYEVPSRGMNGVKSRLLTATRGLLVMTTTSAGYRPYAGDLPSRSNGNILSKETGAATAYAIVNAQQRGALLASPGDEVFMNQVVGISSTDQDMKMNICKKMKLDNMRSAGKDETVKITPAKEMTLEEAVEYIVDNEFVEVTPGAVRIGVSNQK